MHLYAIACLVGERTTCHSLSSPTKSVSGIEHRQSSLPDCTSTHRAFSPNHVPPLSNQAAKVCALFTHQGMLHLHSMQDIIPGIIIKLLPSYDLLCFDNKSYASSSTDHFHSCIDAVLCTLKFLYVHVLLLCWAHLTIYPSHTYLSSLEARVNRIAEGNTHSKLYNNEGLGLPILVLAQSGYKSKTNG